MLMYNIYLLLHPQLILVEIEGEKWNVVCQHCYFYIIASLNLSLPLKHKRKVRAQKSLINKKSRSTSAPLTNRVRAFAP